MPVATNRSSFLLRVLPIAGWLPAYQRAWLLPDILAGLAVWAVVVPEGMAYAAIVGVPPIMGPYALVPPLIATRRLVPRTCWWSARTPRRPTS